jgi:hypothetical protein
VFLSSYRSGLDLNYSWTWWEISKGQPSFLLPATSPPPSFSKLFVWGCVMTQELKRPKTLRRKNYHSVCVLDLMFSWWLIFILWSGLWRRVVRWVCTRSLEQILCLFSVENWTWRWLHVFTHDGDRAFAACWDFGFEFHRRHKCLCCVLCLLYKDSSMEHKWHEGGKNLKEQNGPRKKKGRGKYSG